MYGARSHTHTHSHRLYNTLLNDLQDPLMLADIPSSQISSVETLTYALTPLPNYRVSRDETLKQHFSVWLKKRSLSPVKSADRQSDRRAHRKKY